MTREADQADACDRHRANDAPVVVPHAHTTLANPRVASSTTRFYLGAPVRHADLGHAQLSYRCFGEGPALLLVHGFPLSGFTWRKLVPELAKRYRCYVPDLPGMGDSVWTDGTDFSFFGQGRTLKSFVDRLELTRYHVLGQDTGGTFARCLALVGDARIEKLAILNSEIPGQRPPWIPLLQKAVDVPGTMPVLRHLLRSRTFIRSGMAFGGCFVDHSLLEGEFREHVILPLRSQRRMDGVRAYLRGLKWGAVDDLAEAHARITVPVRLIWGADDPTFPVEQARKMVGQLPSCNLVEISSAKLLVRARDSGSGRTPAAGALDPWRARPINEASGAEGFERLRATS